MKGSKENAPISVVVQEIAKTRWCKKEFDTCYKSNTLLTYQILEY